MFWWNGPFCETAKQTRPFLIRDIAKHILSKTLFPVFSFFVLSFLVFVSSDSSFLSAVTWFFCPYFSVFLSLFPFFFFSMYSCPQFFLVYLTSVSFFTWHKVLCSNIYCFLFFSPYSVHFSCPQFPCFLIFVSMLFPVLSFLDFLSLVSLLTCPRFHVVLFSVSYFPVLIS
jgi:hypothetical protein